MTGCPFKPSDEAFAGDAPDGLLATAWRRLSVAESRQPRCHKQLVPLQLEDKCCR